MSEAAARLEKLLDAIDLVKTDRREEARQLLRDLIRDDNNFEEAWLWMSVAVDSLDQSSLSLENVLRVNPHNYEAAGALYRIRIPEMQVEKRRAQLRWIRDTSTALMWFVIMMIIFGVLMTIPTQ